MRFHKQRIALHRNPKLQQKFTANLKFPLFLLGFFKYSIAQQVISIENCIQKFFLKLSFFKKKEKIL